MTMHHAYEQDFYAWTREQAELLRGGILAGADLDHIAEEIESMGKREKRELESRLAVLLLHLLKWQFQPALRGTSWQTTIRIQRLDIAKLLADSPSLKAVIPDITHGAYETAAIRAGAETGLPEAAFPTACPWDFEQIMDPAVWPVS
jgi:hypothetical protein